MNAPRVLARIGLVCFASLVLGACSSLNPFASSAPKLAPLPTFSPTAELRTDWQGQVGGAGGYVFQPAVVGTTVFAAAYDGSVARFDEGRRSWRVSLDGKLSAGVGANDKLVVVVSEKGEVLALDAASGELRWKAPLNAEVLAAPAVADSLVVARTSDHRLIGLDAADGKRRWTYQRNTPALALRSFAGVAVEGAAAIAGFPGGKLVAVSIANGGAVWELTVASPKGATELERVADVVGIPAVTRQEVCAVAYQGRIACFDGNNGNSLWSREFSSVVGLDRDTRRVYVTDDKDAVHALDVFTGASLWKQDKFNQRGVSRPVIVGNYVAVADREGYVHLLQREDGALAARVKTDGSAILASPKPYRSGVVVQTHDGGIYALSVQ